MSERSGGSGDAGGANRNAFRSLDNAARERFRLLSRAMEPRNPGSSSGRW
jgi:hypothetical protein